MRKRWRRREEEGPVGRCERGTCERSRLPRRGARRGRDARSTGPIASGPACSQTARIESPFSLSRLSLIPSSIYGSRSRSRSRSDLSRREWEWEWEWHLYPTNYSIGFGPFPSSPVGCGLWRASGTRSCGSTLTKGPHPKPTLHYINK
jgi:hypothetical protein